MLVQRIQVVLVRLHYFRICLNIIVVAMVMFLEKLENKVTIHHLHIKRFHMVERLWKSVQYIRRYSTKYAEHVNTQHNFNLLACSPPKLPIFTKILHVIVAFVVLLYFAYTRHYPIPFANGKATK